jgi:hypothetical protein
VRAAVQEWLGEGSQGNDILAEPFYALPNGRDGVVYCARKQSLSATLQGIIENLLCFPESADGVATFDPDAPGCELTDEEIQLVLETLNANAFDFTAMDLVSGDYKVTVEAEISTGTDSQKGGAAARGMVGLGSMVVDEVRFAKNEDAGSGLSRRAGGQAADGHALPSGPEAGEHRSASAVVPPAASSATKDRLARGQRAANPLTPPGTPSMVDASVNEPSRRPTRNVLMVPSPMFRV